jgi:hypothetical protein
LKIPAADGFESSILKVVHIYSNRSLIPQQQATGNALAPGFKPSTVNYSIKAFFVTHPLPTHRSALPDSGKYPQAAS